MRKSLFQFALVVWGCWCAFQLWQSYTQDAQVFFINASTFGLIAAVFIALPIFANLMGKLFGASEPLFDEYWPKAIDRKTGTKSNPAQEGMSDHL